MKAEITFREIWSNPSVRNFFFRDQSEETLQELCRRAEDWEDALDLIEDYAEVNFLFLDDIEEMFYVDEVEELASEFHIKLEDEDESED